MRGRLGPGVLLSLLEGLRDARKSGTLRLAQGKSRREIRLRRGLIVDGGEAGAPALDDDDERADRAYEVLRRAFLDMDGSYGFEETEAGPVEEGPTQRLAPGERMLALARGVENDAAVEYAVGDLDRLLNLVADPLLRLQKIKLHPSDAFLLSRIDGTFKASEVLTLVSGPREPALRSLFALICAGLVRFAGRRKPIRRPRGQRPRA